MARRVAIVIVLGMLLLVGGWSARGEPALRSCELLLGTSTSTCEQLSPSQQDAYEWRLRAVDTGVWSAMVLGGLLVLAGWTVGRDLDLSLDKPRPRTG